MENTVAGFKARGSWNDVVEHGERVTRALRECGAVNGAFEDWDEWRPKSHERMETEVSEKTAEQASVPEGAGERAGRTPDEDLRTAGERLSESYEELEGDDTDAAVEKWHDSMDYMARAADSAGRKVLRRVESTVYQRVMTQIAPYYFDNQLVSANIQRVHRPGDEVDRFVFEVNVNDDELKSDVAEKLAEYEETIERWHVDTKKAVESAEAAEGVEVTEEELGVTTAEPPEADILPDAEKPLSEDNESNENDA